MLHCVGSYRELDVRIAIDPSRRYSVLSSEFATRHAVPLTVRVGRDMVATRFASGPIFVPTQSGRYVCIFTLHVERSPAVDIVLGDDWIQMSGAILYEGVLLNPGSGPSDEQQHARLQVERLIRLVPSSKRTRPL